MKEMERRGRERNGESAKTEETSEDKEENREATVEHGSP